MKVKTLKQHLKEQYPTKRSRKKLEDGFSRLALGYEIFLARKHKKLTQAELAKKLATTQSVIARIENGEQNLTTDKLNKIAEALKKKLEITFK